MAKSVVISYVDQFVACVKGDTDAVRGEKTLRQAQTGIETHIQAYKGETLDLEDKVEKAEENLRLTRLNNGTLISNRQEYVSNLIVSKNNLRKAEKALQNHLDTVKFLKEQLDLIK